MKLVRDDTMAAMMFWSSMGVRLAHPFAGHVILNKDDLPVGAFVVNNYDGINCDISGIGQHCWHRQMLMAFARYVFVELGCRRATARTRPSNVKAINTLLALGFRLEGRLRLGFGDEDSALYGLLLEDLTILRKTGCSPDERRPDEVAPELGHQEGDATSGRDKHRTQRQPTD